MFLGLRLHEGVNPGLKKIGNIKKNCRYSFIRWSKFRNAFAKWALAKANRIFIFINWTGDTCTFKQFKHRCHQNAAKNVDVNLNIVYEHKGRTRQMWGRKAKKIATAKQSVNGCSQTQPKLSFTLEHWRVNILWSHSLFYELLFWSI